MRFIALLFVLVMHSAGNAYACLGLDSQDYILLQKLPSTAMTQEVVAKVVVLSPEPLAVADSVIVSVIDGIKGVNKGEMLHVSLSGSSCSYLANQWEFVKGKQPNFFYIAGDIKPPEVGEGLKQFHGAWRGDKRAH